MITTPKGQCYIIQSTWSGNNLDNRYKNQNTCGILFGKRNSFRKSQYVHILWAQTEMKTGTILWKSERVLNNPEQHLPPKNPTNTLDRENNQYGSAEKDGNTVKTRSYNIWIFFAEDPPRQGIWSNRSGQKESIEVKKCKNGVVELLSYSALLLTKFEYDENLECE